MEVYTNQTKVIFTNAEAASKATPQWCSQYHEDHKHRWEDGSRYMKKEEGAILWCLRFCGF